MSRRLKHACSRGLGDAYELSQSNHEGELASLSSSTWSRRFCSFELTPLLRPSTSPAHSHACSGSLAQATASQHGVRLKSPSLIDEVLQEVCDVQSPDYDGDDMRAA